MSHFSTHVFKGRVLMPLEIYSFILIKLIDCLFELHCSLRCINRIIVAHEEHFTSSFFSFIVNCSIDLVKHILSELFLNFLVKLTLWPTVDVALLIVSCVPSLVFLCISILALFSHPLDLRIDLLPLTWFIKIFLVLSFLLRKVRYLNNKFFIFIFWWL